MSSQLVHVYQFLDDFRILEAKLRTTPTEQEDLANVLRSITLKTKELDTACQDVLDCIRQTKISNCHHEYDRDYDDYYDPGRRTIWVCSHCRHVRD